MSAKGMGDLDELGISDHTLTWVLFLFPSIHHADCNVFVFDIFGQENN